MLKIDERISIIIRVKRTLGYDLSELSTGKREAIIDLFKEVFSDDPEKLVRNVKIRLGQIKTLLVEESQKKVNTEKTMNKKAYKMKLYKALPIFDGESSISYYLKKFENAMRCAEYEMVNKEGNVVTVRITEKIKVMWLYGKLLEKVSERLVTLGDT